MTDKELFVAALDFPPEEQSRYLTDKAENTEQRQRVAALLKAHREAGEFLQGGTAEPGFTEQITAAPPVFGRDQPGQIIAHRYKLVELIGEGGMGSVWMAEQLQPVKRMVAVKLIKPGMDSRQVLVRFEAERQALALMDHPNIAKILDGGATADGRPYFVMELVRGIPITEYCDDRNLPIAARLELFALICQAVQHAHQKGILHRDLKPGNLLVTEHDSKPVPKVIDFGLAKAVQPSISLTDQTLHTSFGTVVGTPLYMAPEQVALNALDIDTRADIYALGVILYELLTGTTPLEKERFRRAAWEEVKRLIQEEEPPKPSTRLSASTQSLPSIAARRHVEPGKLGRLVRGDLDWIVMKALEKDRNRRYPTANALAEEVNRFLHLEPVLAGPPSARYKIRKFVQRHRASVLAASSMLLMLLLGVCGTVWGWSQAARQREIAEAERENAVRQQRRAEEQRKVAEAVTQFLQNDLLGQANLANQSKEAGERSADLKVVTLLQRAGAELAGKFKDQPTTEFSLRLTVGDALAALGLHTEAEPHLMRALQIAEGLQDHERVARAKSYLGRLRARQGQLTEAQRLLDESTHYFVQERGADHPDTLYARLQQAQMFLQRGKLPEAERQLRVLAKLGSQKLPPDLNLSVLHSLANTLREQDRHAEAEAICREVVEGRTELLGADHPQTLESLNNLASNLMAQGRPADAAGLYRKLAALSGEKLGIDHPDTLAVRGNLGLALQREGKMAEAEATFREVLKARSMKLGAEHPGTLATRHNLAVLLAKDLKRPDQAEPLQAENVAACNRTLGPDHPHTIVVKAALGATLRDLKKYAEAEKLARECHAATARQSPNNPQAFIYQAELGYLLLQQKKHEEAETQLLAAYAGLNQRGATAAWQRRWPALVAGWLADLFEAKGQRADAEKWRVEAAKFVGSPKPPIPP